MAWQAAGGNIPVSSVAVQPTGTFDGQVPVRVYVTQSGAGNMDGTSWADAYGSDQLQTALSTAGLRELWVAEGIYYPTTSAAPNDRDANFNLPDSLQWYGGFAGTETDISQRDKSAHQTIISGNIGDTTLQTDNSYFLLNVFGASAGILLDGITLSDAYNTFGSGALRLNAGSMVELVDCRFEDNVSYAGGGITVSDSSRLTLHRCVFENNLGIAGGGGIFGTDNAVIQVRNSIFRSNYSHDSGGAYFGRADAEASFVNCLFDGNFVNNYAGGAIYLGMTTIARFTNCTVVNSGGRPAFAIRNSSVGILENCIVWANSWGAGITDNYSHSIIQGVVGSDPLFVGPSDFRLQLCSPASNTGSNAYIAGFPTDLDGNPRDYNGLGVDMGAYEIQDSSILVLPFSLRGGGAECNNTLEPIVLDSSQFAVSYQLQSAGLPVGAPVAGTGGPLTVGMPTASGNHTVYGVSISGCTGDMEGSVNAWLGPFETALSMDDSLSGETITLLTDIGRELDSIIWQRNDTTVFVEPDGFVSAGQTVAGGNGYDTAGLEEILPTDLFLRGDSLYVADAGAGNRVTLWTPGATAGTLVAGGNGTGSGLAQLNEPQSIWVDGSGNIYIADAQNHRVVKWAPGATAGILVAGDTLGAGSDAHQLNFPYSIFVDMAGNLYVSDFYNHRVQRWATGAAVGETVAGGAGMGAAADQLAYPTGIWVDKDGNLYISDAGNSRIMKWAPGASEGQSVPFGGTTLGPPAEFNDIRVEADGTVIAAGDGQVLRWRTEQVGTTVIAGGNGWGSQPDQLKGPLSVALGADGTLFVSDKDNFRVQSFSPGVASLQRTASGCGTWRAITTDAYGCVDTSAVVEVLTRWYVDADGDGYGSQTAYEDACPAPSNGSYAPVGTDCDDNDAAIHPGQPEICNDGIDNDCDGRMYEVPAGVIAEPLVTGCSGETLSAWATHQFVRWYDAPQGGNVLGTGPRLDRLVLNPDTVYAAAFDPVFEELVSVRTDSARYKVDHEALSGDDGRGLAVTPDHVFYTGDGATVRYDHRLQNGVTLPRLDRMFSDLATGRLYGLTYYNEETSTVENSFERVNRILEFDTAGVATGDTIVLSMTLENIGCSRSSLFNGSGYVLLYANIGKKIYRIDINTGQVTVVMEYVDLDDEIRGAESCWSWNMSTYDGEGYSLLYRKRNTDLLVRLHLMTAAVDTVAEFQGIGNEAAQFIFSPWDGLLFVHNEDGNNYNGQQGGEWLFAFDATGAEQVACQVPREPVVFQPAPCPAPGMPLMRSGSRPYTDVVLAWLPPLTCSNAVTTDIYFSSQAVPPDTATVPTYSSLSGDSLTVAFLWPDSTYYAWFRTQCGAGYSEWVGPVSYTLPGLGNLAVSTDPVSLCDGEAFTASVAGLLQDAVVRWYDAPSGGNQLDTGLAASFVADLGETIYAEVNVLDSTLVSRALGVTGAAQQFIVPDDVFRMTIFAQGARGGLPLYNCGSDPTYGKGGSVTADLAVQPGDTLYVFVGGIPDETSYDSIGTGGYNGGGGGDYYGGGGGGATDIRKGGIGWEHRVLVAGGGGGGTWCNYYGDGYAGGAGGGLVAGDGTGYFCGDCGGKGGTQYEGGAGGAADGNYEGVPGGFGYGGSIPDPFYYYCEAGGGGGGYYGGGSGGECYSSGGGGSSYTDSVLCSNVVHTQGDNDGPGAIIFNYYQYRTYTVRLPLFMTDTTAPAAHCRSLTLNLDGNGQAVLVAATVDSSSSDACGIGGMLLSRTVFTCADLGIQEPTLTVTDINGNSSSCIATVAVADTVAPLALCKDVTVSLDGNGQFQLTATHVDHGSTDACGIAERMVSPASFSCADLGPQTVTLTVTDSSLNSAACAAVVTVMDLDAPVAACQDIVRTVEGTVVLNPEEVFNAAASFDNCGAVIPLSVSPHEFDCSDVGGQSVTLTVTDLQGNTATCQAMVTVQTIPISVDVSPELCGLSNGSVMVSINSAAGGQVGYSLNGGQSYQFTNVFTDLSAGSYELVVTYFGDGGCILPAIPVVVPVLGEIVNTWTGGGDALHWSDRFNWSIGFVPLGCHDIIVPPGKKILVLSGEVATGRTLHVSQGSEVTLEPGALMDIENY